MKRSIEESSLWQSHKRQSIQEAAIQLLSREGLQAVTMERVAREVGIAKGTVYLHYKDKQQLLDAIKEAALDPLVLRLEEVLQSDQISPARKLQSYSLRYLTYFDERRTFFRVLLYEREVTRVQNSRYRTDRYLRLMQATSAVIDEGIRLGAFRSLPSSKAATIFMESNFAMMSQRLLSAGNAPVEEDAQLITDIFLRGISVDASPAKSRRRASSKARKAS